MMSQILFSVISSSSQVACVTGVTLLRYSFLCLLSLPFPSHTKQINTQLIHLKIALRFGVHFHYKRLLNARDYDVLLLNENLTKFKQVDFTLIRITFKYILTRIYVIR